MKTPLTRIEMKEIYSGLNLRQYRDEKCYSQEYISSQLGLSQSTYQRIESGELKITLERLMKLADILDKPLEMLLKREADKSIVKLITVSESEWELMKKIISQQEKRIQELEIIMKLK